MKPKLKPCPCCGSCATFYDWYYVKCSNSSCGMRSGLALTKQEAADKWNQRHHEQSANKWNKYHIAPLQGGKDADYEA